MAWPASLDVFPSAACPSAATLHAHKLSNDAHSTLHDFLASRVVDIEGRIGVPSAPAAGSLHYRVTALEAAIAQLRQGWYLDTAVPVAVDATHFTFDAPADRAADFHCGLKAKWLDNGVGQKYGTVYACASVPNTPSAGIFRHTVTLIPADDFVINTGMVAGSLYVSPMDNPQGFPKMLTWAPGLATSGTAGAQQGRRGSTAVHDGRYRVNGGFLTFEFVINWAGSGIAQGTGSYRVLLPVAMRSVGNHNAVGVANIRSGGFESMGEVQAPGAVAYVNIRTLDRTAVVKSPNPPGGAVNVFASMVACAGNGATGTPNTWTAGDWIQGTCTVPLPGS